MSLAEQQEELLSSVQRYVEDVAPIAKCFFDFIMNHDVKLEEPLDFYLGTSAGMGKTPEFEDFTMILEGLTEEEAGLGVSYRFVLPEVDGCDNLYFTVPFEYFEGPNEWEEYYLAQDGEV